MIITYYLTDLRANPGKYLKYWRVGAILLNQKGPKEGWYSEAS